MEQLEDFGYDKGTSTSYKYLVYPYLLAGGTVSTPTCLLLELLCIVTESRIHNNEYLFAPTVLEWVEPTRGTP